MVVKAVETLHVVNIKINKNNLTSKNDNLENSIFTNNTSSIPRPLGNPRKRRKFNEENPPISITFATIFKRKYKRKKGKSPKPDKY